MAASHAKTSGRNIPWRVTKMRVCNAGGLVRPVNVR
jgi:hypothetical protein